MLEGSANKIGFVGKVGERKEFVLKFIDKTSWLQDNVIKNVIEIAYCYKFKDDLGNLFVWFTSLSLQLETCAGEYIPVVDGDTIILAGTIKEYKWFRGTKEIILTNCQVVAINSISKLKRNKTISVTKAEELELKENIF